MDALIRPARDADVPALLEMGRAFNIEAKYEDSIPFDEASFYKTLECLSQANLLLVAEKDGKVIGMAGSDLGPAICNHSILIAREAFWYVIPGMRYGVGGELLDALEETAKVRGAKLFDVVAEERKRDQALDRLYRRRGFDRVENTYRKVL